MVLKYTISNEANNYCVARIIQIYCSNTLCSKMQFDTTSPYFIINFCGGFERCMLGRLILILHEIDLITLISNVVFVMY